MTEYRRPIDNIVISHLGNASFIQMLARAIKEPDVRELGYHFGISDNKGVEYSGIPLDTPEPSQRGHGTNSVGILFYGDLGKRLPTLDETDTLASILVDVVDLFGIDPENIRTHKEIDKYSEGMDGLHIYKIRHEFSLRNEKIRANIRQRILRGMRA